MTTFVNFRPLLGAALFVTSVAALAATPAQKTTAKAAVSPQMMTVSDIQACARRNLVDRGALRDLDVTATDREGKVHGLKMKLYWKPAKNGDARLNLRLVEPLPLRGSSYLLLQNGSNEEVYFYLPGADRSLRITGQNMSEPLWNTDFSYGEIKQVLGLLAAGETRRIGDGTVAGRPTYVLETSMAMEETGYSRSRSFVDQVSCVVLKSEFFGKGEQPRKLMEADVSTLLATEDYNLVLGYTMRDLQQGSRTQIALSDFSLQERLPERLFEPKRFFEAFE